MISAVSSAAYNALAVPGAPGRGRPAEAGGGSGLTPEEQQRVKELKATDRKVRAHELAHQAAGGNLAGGATFTYVLGPDHQRYAVGGEVPIDVSPGRTPEETLRRAAQVRAAALAPADPSGQDRQVAAQAARLEQQARQEQAAAGDADGAPASAAVEAYRKVARDGESAGGFSAVA